MELQYIFESKSGKTLFQDLFQNKYGTWKFFNSVLLPFGVPLADIDLTIMRQAQMGYWLRGHEGKRNNLLF